jgi:putative photosynthetic complex assembly protein 2
MWDSPWIAALAALFLWWFSTGILMWRVRRADNLGPGAHLRSTVLALPLLGLGLAGAAATAGDGSPRGAHLAFLSALAVWAWIELAFLSGIVTGPNRGPCPPGAGPGERFVLGALTLLWHELALLAALALLAWLAHDAANAFAYWTFGVLFLARISAKLNLVFGVPRFHTEFLPRPLAHIPSYFRRAPINPFFPFAVSLLTFAAFCWVERMVTVADPGQVTGFALLAALTLLALLEHWFMVLPIPDQKLWRWMIPALKPIPSAAPAAKD